jgi:GNAT superfamily N-acetyltransferase
VIEIFRLNTPDYFDVDEENDLIEYLRHRRDDYFVIELDGEIMGAGGLNIMDDGISARISWDLIHPKAQGKGLGSQLVQYRIEKVKRIPEIKILTVRTSQVAHQFYARFDFELIETIRDYWAVGFDLYHMEMEV